MGLDFFYLKIVGTVLLSIALVACCMGLIYISLEGRIFVFGNRFFDFHKVLKNKDCIDCGTHLTDENQSQWHIYVKDKRGKECLANICLNCQEVKNRMWGFYQKDEDGESLSLQGDEIEIRNHIKDEMIDEGIWMNYEALKKRESAEISDALK